MCVCVCVCVCGHSVFLPAGLGNKEKEIMFHPSSACGVTFAGRIERLPRKKFIREREREREKEREAEGTRNGPNNVRDVLKKSSVIEYRVQREVAAGIFIMSTAPVLSGKLVNYNLS